MIHPATELRLVNEVIGLGVFATARIPRGTITWVRDRLDLAMSPEAMRALGPSFQADLDKFSFTDGAGDRVLCWDIARYVNHSCDAPCLAPGFDFEFAVRDIAVGEQLCDDYGTLNLIEPFACACGYAACRSVIRPDDHVRLSEVWDGRVRDAFPSIGRVEQPLMGLVNRVDEVTRVLAGGAPVPSCRVHFPAVGRG
jgi:uncharacterized protein